MLTGFFTMLPRAISILSEGLEVYDQIKSASSTDTEQLNAKVKAFFVAVQTLSLGAETSQASLTTQDNLKLAEFGASLVHLVTDTTVTMEGSDTTLKKFESIFANFAKTLRIVAEGAALEEKKYLAMTDEERASATRPSTEGEKPIDVEECRTNLEEAQNFAYNCQTAEMVGRSHLISFAKEQVERFSRFIGLTRDDHRRRMDGDASHLRAGTYSAFSTIPEAFHEDPILSQYICPITLCPIRYPLRDPVIGHIYEAHAILAWVTNNHTSPLTRNRLEPGDLQQVPGLQARIAARLRNLEETRAELLDL